MGKRPSQKVQSTDDAETCLKLCPKCDKLLPTSSFCIARKAYDGLFWKCRSCQAAYVQSVKPHKNAVANAHYRDVVRWRRLAATAITRPPYASKYNPLALDLRKK